MSTTSKKVHVALETRRYDIEIASGAIKKLDSFVEQFADYSHLVVITDSNVDSLYGEYVENLQAAPQRNVTRLVVPAGEKSKSVAQADSLWQQMLSHGTDRKSAVLALGGGVVGDLAGFVAATFARGLDLLQVPTTLLAQVDSSVGGKVGINLPDAKNMVGAFWQPKGVLIDPAVLSTLPEREYRAGLAEVVKYGVIADADFFQYLEEQVEAINSREQDVLSEIVRRCCRIKADVVEQDERETTGLRVILNYGHTYCHALEAITDYGVLLHGEAVAIGMTCAARLAYILGRVENDFVQRQQTLLSQLNLTTALPDVSHDQLLKLMQHDKKVEHGQLRFILPSAMGEVELVGNVSPENVKKSLAC